jgi:hypothetical protein
MSLKCCNPSCNAPFDYRQGRLIRVVNPISGGKGRPEQIHHYWVCGRCATEYVLESQSDHTLTMKPRDGHSENCECSAMSFA